MSTAEFPLSLFSQQALFFRGSVRFRSNPLLLLLHLRSHVCVRAHTTCTTTSSLFLPRPGKGESVQKFLSSGPCAHCRNSSSPYSAEHNFQSTLARLWQFRQAWASCTARTVTGCGAGKPQQLWRAFPKKSSLDGPGGAPFSLQSAHRPVLSIQSRWVLAPTSSEKAPSKPRKRCWDSKRRPTKCYVALNMS